MPRHCEVPGGLVNAIGLQGPGVEAFIENYIPHYRMMAEKSVTRSGSSAESVPPLIVNIWGGSIEEYGEVAARLSDVPLVGAIECNVSCPNVKEGGHTFGQDPAVLARLVKTVRVATGLPLIVNAQPTPLDEFAVARYEDLAAFAKVV